MQKISEEPTGNVLNSTQTENREANIQSPPAKCRRTCSTRQCKNRATDVFATIVSNLFAENVRKNDVDCACHKNVCC